MNKFEIYTDGAYSSSTNQGGWAFVVVKNGELIDKNYDGLINTTNNRMEIMGMLEAMKYVNQNITDEVVLYSDSMYVIGTLTLNWKMNKNTDLWPLVFNEIKPNMIFKHVKGPNGDKWNTECDKWAVFGKMLLNCEIDLK
jgi:ribonuclease HI